MPGYDRRSRSEAVDFGQRLLFLLAIIISTAGMAAYLLGVMSIRNPALNMLPFGLVVGIPAGIAVLCAFAYCILGTLKETPWMRTHFRWLWWIIFDDEDFAPTRSPEPESARIILGGAMDRISETVKDAIVDLGVTDAMAPPPPVPPPLPPMERNVFVAALRPRVDELLARMADEINNAPMDDILDVSKERVHPLLDELEDEVLAQGLRLRIDAAYAELAHERRPQGEWAKKYRTMVLSSWARQPWSR